MPAIRYPLLRHARRSSLPPKAVLELTDKQLSSGYTVDPETGNRWVFTMNKKRYPDFAGMVKNFHKSGIKVVPNVKPCRCSIGPGIYPI